MQLRDIVVPVDNLKEIEKLGEEFEKNVTFHGVENVLDALDYLLEEE